MKKDFLISTEIKLPELKIEQIKIGKNKVSQIAQNEEVIKVDVYKYKPTCFLLEDTVGRIFYLKMPNSKFKDINSNVLKIKDYVDINSIGIDSRLLWDNHILQNSPKNPDEVVNSWENVFNFKRAKNNGDLGLRTPQVGAIHAISSHWSVKDTCATIVMPTGTGKTETMLSILVYEKCRKILILVPSKTLRKQISDKFLSLGCLKKIGVINPIAVNPRVALIEHGIKDKNEITQIVNNSNVIITTSSALKNFPDEIKQILIKNCSHLFVDEAHHIVARTWNSIKELFKDKKILQFTATPYRNDGAKIEGDIIYNYPLGIAQENGYFKKINLIKLQEFDENIVDEEIAKSAISALKTDIESNKDHILMARCKEKDRVEGIFSIYKKHASEFNPLIITSDLNNSEYLEAIRKLQNRETRIIICVDMLGEGFDLPNLKIAALHDTHKSLAITLQFIGRFTRIDPNVGDATVVINIDDPKVNKELESLYSEDADWNILLKQKSESTIQKEIDFHNFINNFTGELATHVSLWNLRPSFSTLVYSTKTETWNPNKFTDIIPPKYKYWHAINNEEKVLVIVISKFDEVNWGKYKDIKNYSFDLYIVHWSNEHKALFINSSNYDVLNCDRLAKSICGDLVEVKNGQKVFNVFSGIERTLARNIGVSTIGNISYTMHFGSDVTTGLTRIDKSQGVLNNIFGWGYESGERKAVGCSAKKGKVWARGGGPIMEWKQWCHSVATKIFDNNLKENDIIKDFLRPEKLEKRHDSVPLSIQWSEYILSAQEENISIFIGSNEYKLYDISLDIIDYSDKGDIVFKVASFEKESIYKIQFGKNGCKHDLTEGDAVKVRKYNGDLINLTDYVEKEPLTIIYADGSFSYNNWHVPTPKLKTFFDVNTISVLDWQGTDIKVESMGKKIKQDSVQYKIANNIKDDYDIVFNDDASGEAADIIALRKESSDSYRLHLIHCKFSADKTPGARIGDFYALCGQAQKCISWKHNGMEHLSAHMKKRENKWNESDDSRFFKGDINEFNKLKKFSRFATKCIFEVTIVQPGLSKAKISDDIIQLLASTEDYLHKTSGAKFNVISSK